jgi:hypothetical protein
MAQQHVTLDAGRLLIAAEVIDQLTHLAVGDGDGSGAPSKAATALQNELGRALYLQRFFVELDSAGPVVVGAAAYRQVAGPAHLIYFRFRFAETEAQGNWSELLLCGGGVAFIARAAVLVDGSQAGDDRANFQAIVGGAYTGNENQTLTITVSTGGGSGVAEVSWVSTGSEAPDSATVTFGTPVVLGTTGVTLTFDGGTDAVLTIGDQWQLRLTQDPTSPSFAAGGAYDPVGNEDGEVRVPGTGFRLYHVDPPEVKGAAIVDVQLVTEVFNDA